MAEFEPALAITLRWEGGFVDDPSDPGGPTAYGISSTHNPDVDVEEITEEDAKCLYRTRYWDPLRLGAVSSQQVANKVFDFQVLTGKGTLFLQRALNANGCRLIEDNRFGPKTLHATNAMDSSGLVPALRSEGGGYLRCLADHRPALAKYKRGWLRRAYS